jgi:aconitate hydratase
MASHIYETMSHNLEIIRTRLGRPLTLADKILLGHLVEPQTQA